MASSRIENFIGFPAGLSGADLATRGVLQMLKFGATMVAPVDVEKLTPASLPTSCTCCTWIAVPRFAVASYSSLSGVHWRRLEAAGADRFRGCRHLLRLHDGRSRPLRRHRRRGRRRRQLRRTGRHVPGRVLSARAQVHLLDPSHAGSRHVGILIEPDPGNRQRGCPRTDRDRRGRRKSSPGR